MNRRQRQTLNRIFKRPTPPDIRWQDVEAVFLALGADLSDGAGSRVRVALHNVRAVFHRPHPTPHMRRSAVRNVRDFLEAAGVEPERR